MISHRATEPQSETKTGSESQPDALTEKIIRCAIEVHRQLGPGLLESVYESAMAIELEIAGLKFQRQVVVPIQYGDRILGEHRLDLAVDYAVVELKSVERFDPVFEAQILTYLKLTKIRTGLIINFNSRLVHEGIRRFVL
jgi:GxxExxY protein